MKKKILMVAVLLGALSLGSCVDDNESQSVTDVRNAKTEQLKAQASLYSAQAEAAVIMANAEKAYKEAQAAYQQALAAAKQAEADSIEFRLQQAKDEYAANLEAINLEAQTRLLKAKKEAAEAERDFLALANAQLKQLYTNYSKELSTLNNLKSQLNVQKNRLAQYEAQMITTEQFIAAQKASLENDILGYQAKIEAYKSYEGKDKSELEAEVEGLRVAQSNLYMGFITAQIAANTAKTEYNKVIAPFSAYSEKATLKTVLAVPTLRQLGVVVSEEDFVIDEDQDLSVSRYVLSSEYSVEQTRQNLTATEKNEKDLLGVKKSGEAAATGLYAQLESAEKKLADAITAKDEALINRAKLDVANFNDQIANQLKVVEEATQNLKDFEAAIASFSGEDLKAYDAALAALKEDKAVVAYVEALEAETEAEEAWTVALAQYQAASSLLFSAVDAKAEILNLEALIATCQASIAQLVNDDEYNVQYTKDRIADLTVQIELEEAVVEMAKKELDAAIAAQGQE